MKISYATHADVLYIVLKKTEDKCAYVELESGIICRIDESKDEIVGITIPDFRRRAELGEEFIIPGIDEGFSAEQVLQLLGAD